MRSECLSLFTRALRKQLLFSMIWAEPRRLARVDRLQQRGSLVWWCITLHDIRNLVPYVQSAECNQCVSSCVAPNAGPLSPKQIILSLVILQKMFKGIISAILIFYFNFFVFTRVMSFLLFTGVAHYSLG